MFAYTRGNGIVDYLYSFYRAYRFYRDYIVDKALLLKTGAIFFICIISIPRFPDARPIASWQQWVAYDGIEASNS